jgi:hypothetical protein
MSEREKEALNRKPERMTRYRTVRRLVEEIKMHLENLAADPLLLEDEASIITDLHHPIETWLEDYKNELAEVQLLHVIVITDGYVPDVAEVYKDKVQALDYAKCYASEWENAETRESGRIYFNQEEEGNMDKSISVIEFEVE